MKHGKLNHNAYTQKETLPMDADADIMINIEFGTSLLIRILDDGGVRAWNRFLGQLFKRNEVAGAWSPGETPPLVDFGFDFRNLQVPCMNLEGVDLWLCELEGANFDGAALLGARIGNCPNASFRNTTLSGAMFCGDISGCDFTGAQFDGIVMDDVTFDPSMPPVGLPPELLSLCKPDHSERRVCPPDNPEEIPHFVPDILDCHASMHFIPKEG
jgi:hypothetical protein